MVHFIRMATDLYLALLLAKDFQFLDDRRKLPFALLCGWFCFRFGQTVILIAISDSTAYEVPIITVSRGYASRIYNSIMSMSNRPIELEASFILC